MFTKTELQVVIKTLSHRRDWLEKNLNNPEFASNKAQNQETLPQLDSALRKLAPPEKAGDTGPRAGRGAERALALDAHVDPRRARTAAGAAPTRGGTG